MITDPADALREPPPRRWWEHPALLGVVVLLSAVPLLWPGIPPLVDLPGHMGRYAVQLDIDGSPALQAFYDFKWQLIGNLGVDLLVVPLAHVFGLQLAVKLIVLAIPPMIVAGLLWVAREVHLRVPPTAFFALPFAYSFPFMFGFVNFALSMALALLAFALWLRLARLGRTGMRAAIFVPISILIWVAHTFGWGTLGVMAFSAELVRQFDLKRPILKAGLNTFLHCLALAPPVLLMLMWRSGGHVGGETGEWFKWMLKKQWLLMALRDRWYQFDRVSLWVVWAVLLLGLLWWKKLQYSRNLAASAIFLAIVYVCLPRIVFGSNYADMRLVPFVIAVAVIAIRQRPAAVAKAGSALAALGLLFFAARMAGNAWSFVLYDRTYDRELAAVDQLPPDAKVISFVGVSCRKGWRMTRIEHLPALGIVRRHAFSNDQWSMSGAQLLTARYPDGGWFSRDPSQQVLDTHCRGERWLTLDESLRRFPRDRFDFVWLIEPPRFDESLTKGLTPVWRSGTSVLYRVVDHRPLAQEDIG
ncbi:MAG: hypothetical protein ACJ8EB_02740 [Allosphingosinicella sp.]